MEAAEARENLTSTDQELKRLCTVFGVSQSNQLYRILIAEDKTEATASILQTAHMKSEGRGGEKCGVGQIWDEVRGVCV